MEKRSILIIDDEIEMRKALFEGLSGNGCVLSMAEGAAEALRLFQQKPHDLVITDVRLPDGDGLTLLERIKSTSFHTPVIMITGFGTVQNAVEAMRKGASDYLLKPFSLEMLEQRIEIALNGYRREDLTMPIISQDPRMKEVIHLCQKIAGSKATVLLHGESGTGKELFARYIHSHSPRRGKPFIAVNCASLPDTLFESELFGHEKGAFTGAVGRKIGKFELAHQGTLLLDEISEMSPLLQAKLLRVLQEGEVDRIGGRDPIPVDTRVIATTNRDLAACIERGEFREDLYYRLNVINIKLPPLRERPEDIVFFAHFFLKKFSSLHGKAVNSISDSGLAWLRQQPWRGNVREYKNRMERAVLLATESILQVRDFCDGDPLLPGGHLATEFPALSLREMEKQMIFKALEKTKGNRTHAAEMLGISIRTLRNKLNEYKINNGEPF
jgi:DNA-binding NtrC family response regulator